MKPRPYSRCLMVSVGDLFDEQSAMTLETDKGERFVVMFAKSQVAYANARFTAILTPK